VNISEQRVKSNVGSIEALCEEAICTANLELMVALGFPKEISEILSTTISSSAAQIGVHDLTKHYERAIEQGGPTVINRLIRAFHRVYLSSRAKLHHSVLLDYLDTKDSDLCLLVLTRALNNSEGMLQTRRDIRAKKKASRLDSHTVSADDE